MIRAHLALFTVSVIYGLNYLIAKDVMPGYIQPSGFIMLRVGGALILFWAISLFIQSEKIRKRDMMRLALCGLFGVASNQLLFFNGLNITSPINAAIMMTTNPILVLIAAAIILKNPITIRKVSGIGLGLLGALGLILFGGEFGFGSDTLKGDILVFLNAMSYGIYLVLVKPLMSKYKPITVIKWAFLFGFLFVLPFGAKQFTEIEWASFPEFIWWEVFFVVIATTFLAFLLNIYALKKVQPTVVSIYIYSQPLLAALVSISLGKDSLDPNKLVSAVLIFVGVYLVSIPAKSTQKRE